MGQRGRPESGKQSRFQDMSQAELAPFRHWLLSSTWHMNRNMCHRHWMLSSTWHMHHTASFNSIGIAMIVTNGIQGSLSNQWHTTNGIQGSLSTCCCFCYWWWSYYQFQVDACCSCCYWWCYEMWCYEMCQASSQWCYDMCQASVLWDVPSFKSIAIQTWWMHSMHYIHLYTHVHSMHYIHLYTHVISMQLGMRYCRMRWCLLVACRMTCCLRVSTCVYVLLLLSTFCFNPCYLI